MSDPASFPTQPASQRPADPYIGALVGDRYRILQRIGEGGMGAVYRAEHVLMKKTVALKLLHGELGQKEDATRRFEREAQSASRLSHPNIIAVTDFGRAASGELFLVMEFVPGISLAALLERERRLPVARAVAIGRQILRALEHAHRQGVVHRDLKPANTMLTEARDAGEEGESVKLLDFGIAKMSAGLAEGELPLTQGAMVFGTPSYMSPEQATAGEVDARSDLYACGVMIYEMLAGRKPFVAADAVKVMAMHVTASPPSLAAVAPDARIPSQVASVVMRALEKDKERRFQNAAEFAEALGRALDGGGFGSVGTLVGRASAAARPLLGGVQRGYAHLPWKVRRWAPAAGVALVVLVLVLVPTWLSRTGAEPQQAPPPPKQVEPALLEPLRRIDAAIARGQLPEARAMIMQQLSAHPKEARLHHRLGNLEFAERRPAASLAAYDEALRLDPGLRGDVALLLAVKSLLDDRRVARDALDLLIGRIGKPAEQTLAAIATEDRRLEFRQAARAGCLAIGCGSKVDLVGSYALDLAQARSCDDKRAAVRGLAETKDERAVEPLKKARAAGGPFAGLLGGGNHCVRKEIEAALKQLGE